MGNWGVGREPGRNLSDGESAGRVPFVTLDREHAAIAADLRAAFAEVMRELPPETEAGWLDAQGDLRLAPDIGRKLRTARNVRDLLRQIRLSQSEGQDGPDT